MSLGDLGEVFEMENIENAAYFVSLILNSLDDPNFDYLSYFADFITSSSGNVELKNLHPFFAIIFSDLSQVGISRINDGGVLRELFTLFYDYLEKSYVDCYDFIPFALFIVKVDSVSAEIETEEFEDAIVNILEEIVKMDWLKTLNLMTILLDCENLESVKELSIKPIN